jgi:hypothetical protein
MADDDDVEEDDAEADPLADCESRRCFRGGVAAGGSEPEAAPPVLLCSNEPEQKESPE